LEKEGITMKDLRIKATTRGRITIPVSIRKKLGIKAGTKFKVYRDKNYARIIVELLNKGNHNK
jgi:AbrB family looped-hinge helix DNA binding protein